MACYLISASGAHGYPLAARVLGILPVDKFFTLVQCGDIWGFIFARQISVYKQLLMACYLISASGTHGYPLASRILGILPEDKFLILV